MPKFSHTCVFLLFAFGAGASEAEPGSGFGSSDEARATAERVISVYRERGLAGAIGFVHDPEAGLGDQPLGVNLYHGGRLVADNREPETVGVDYTAVIDLTGDRLWPRMLEALRSEEELATLWPHYETGSPHVYRCSVRSADDEQVIAMVCR